MLTIALLTLGDPGRLTGGYLYHRRMADVAERHDAQVLFGSFPDRLFPLPALRASTVVRAARAADVVLVDSIAACYLAPWLATHRLDLPLAASIHQPPGGIDYGRLRTGLQAPLDLVVYRRACRLLVASDALAETFLAAGFSRRQVRVVAPGRDVAGAQVPPPGERGPARGRPERCSSSATGFRARGCSLCWRLWPRCRRTLWSCTSSVTTAPIRLRRAGPRAAGSQRSDRPCTGSRPSVEGAGRGLLP